ncbi:MAG TPA: general stress protein [Solirubrobacterales bacterium]|nr:general stress protein [Solirubrobacterales bacterium]
MRDREGAARDGIGGESRRAVASFRTYAEAERAVDRLSDRKFPVERVAIVARDLKLVEQVTGRRGYLEAALQGLVSGALIGVLIGWLFGVFNWFEPITSAFWLAIDGLWFGALVGTLFGLLMQALSRGRRDFASVSSLSADRYEVLVDDEVADEAARLLAQTRTPGPAATSAERPGGPEAARPRARH